MCRNACTSVPVAQRTWPWRGWDVPIAVDTELNRMDPWYGMQSRPHGWDVTLEDDGRDYSDQQLEKHVLYEVLVY